MTHLPSKKLKIYLATPYSLVGGTKRASRFIEWWRFRQVNKIAARWMEEGFNIFSPITMSHPVGRCLSSTAPDDHEFWLGIDFAWIDCCDELWVFQQNGWDESYGVNKEIEYAQRHGMPVRYLNRWGDMMW